jgi:hypothetical protein
MLPGIHMAGVDLGGLSAAGAEEVLALKLGERLDRRVAVRVQERIVKVRPAASLRLDAHVQLLRHPPGPPRDRVHRAEGEQAVARDELRARPVRARRLGAHRRRLELGRLRRHRHPNRAREATARPPGHLHERVRLRRPDPHLRPGLEHPRVVLRAAARLSWGAVDRQCGRLGLPAMPGSERAAACFALGRRAEATVA